jgi:bifunctional DNA-binding transcriptional regulator/antitoxin component of YhaV-PrlF toxin-antitoxin module
MVTTTQQTKVTDEGTLSIPEDILAGIGAKPGDTVVVSVDDTQVVRVRRMLTVEELDGVFKLKPGVHADPDFGNVIREATEEYMERIVEQMKDQRVPE